MKLPSSTNASMRASLSSSHFLSCFASMGVIVFILQFLRHPRAHRYGALGRVFYPNGELDADAASLASQDLAELTAIQAMMDGEAVRAHSAVDEPLLEQSCAWQIGRHAFFALFLGASDCIPFAAEVVFQ